MNNLFLIIQMVISIALVILILIQAKGVGLGRAWGGGGEFYKSRRGVEKLIFRLTVILCFLFLATSVVNVILL